MVDGFGFAVKIAAFAALSTMSALGQGTATKEYIRLGNRVIAIENAAPATNPNLVVTSPDSIIGSTDTEQFSAQFNGSPVDPSTVNWSVSNSSAGISSLGLLSWSGPIISPQSITVTATYGGATNTRTITVNPLLSPVAWSFASGGGRGTISVTTKGSWNLTSDSAWIQLQGVVSGTGNGTVDFQVPANGPASALPGNIIEMTTGFASAISEDPCSGCVPPRPSRTWVEQAP